MIFVVRDKARALISARKMLQPTNGKKVRNVCSESGAQITGGFRVAANANASDTENSVCLLTLRRSGNRHRNCGRGSGATAPRHAFENKSSREI